MKVLDLACANRHSFEGWFASEDDFQDQLARGLLECPVCSDQHIVKLLSAPRLNLGAPAAPAAPSETSPTTAVATASAADAAAPSEAALQAAWLKMMRRVVADTENVGSNFAEEARRIHYGEASARGIRGQASRHETEALLEEGIAVLPLPPVFDSPGH